MHCLKTHWYGSRDSQRSPVECKSSGQLLSLYSIFISLYPFSFTVQYLASSGGSRVDTVSFLLFLMAIVKITSSRALLD